MKEYENNLKIKCENEVKLHKYKERLNNLEKLDKSRNQNLPNS